MNKEKIKTLFIKIYSIIKSFIISNYYILFIVLPFIAMDIIISLYGNRIDFYNMFKLPPTLFTISWIVLFTGLTIGFNKKLGKKIYLFICTLFLVLFLTNTVYFSMTKTFFDFNLVESASEGAPYIIDTLKNTNYLVFISFAFVIYLIIKGYKHIPYKTSNNYKIITYTIILFLLIHSLTPLTLGKANKKLTWSSWRNIRNIYNSYNDNNKSLKVSGFYEYCVRNFYVTFLKTKEEEKEEDIEFLDLAFQESEQIQNKYTGIFKDKNLIFIQLEGLDNWLLTEEDTPTMYAMLNNAFVFNNHFSYYNGGGSTFNSEFAINTGFITPLSYTQNAYTFNKNYFPYSLANLFKKEGYSINAFHMNKGEYYSRTANYKNWGYDNYYGLVDMFEYTDESYTLDRELILNEEFNKLIFPEDTKFVDYIIAYSSHLPFTNTTQARALSSLAHTISSPSWSIFGAFTWAVNFVGSQLSLPLRTFARVYPAASFASQTVLWYPSPKFVLRWLVLTAPPLAFLLLYSPNTCGGEFMSSPHPTALGSASIVVLRNTVLACPQERPK